MICPVCLQKALRLSQFIRFNPFKQCRCAGCGVTLRVSLLTRCLCVLTFGLVFASFVYTFPLMYDFIHSQTNAIVRWLLDLFLPFVVIPVQVTLLFLPVGIHTWLRGRLQVVTRSRDREMGFVSAEPATRQAN